MKKIAVALAFIALTAGAIHGQELRNPPAVLNASFNLKYPGAGKPHWVKDGNAYAARFYYRDESYTAHFDEKGRWLDETRKMSFGELRNNVRNAFIQGKFANWRAYEVNEIQQRNGGTQYRILVRNTNETEQRYLFYDAKGQMIGMLTL